jgi:peptidoglycan/xylan/chitin deacetylase (PgdA/CDA1 family)
MGVTVIVYHGVGDCPADQDPYHLFTPVEQFTRQMAYLARYCRVIPIDEVVDGTGGARRRTVAISFDDGYRSVLEEAVPVLRRHRFPATCFVPSRWIGAANGWDTFRPTDRPLLLATTDELREMVKAGVGIESHGHAHLPLGELEEPDIVADLATSREILADVVGRRPRLLAYPYGSNSPAARRAAERCGFEAAFSIGQRAAGPFARERVTIRPRDGMFVYATKTSGNYLALRQNPVTDAGLRVVRPLVRPLRSIS